MKKLTLLISLTYILIPNVYGDRIYICNAPGYNHAGVELRNAMINNGHTVVSDSINYGLLPAGITTACVDSVNGYDWLCFFGTVSYTSLYAEIEAFLNAGGKVFYQYEVSCCTTASSSAATIISALTGLSISVNPNPYIALGGMPGWRATGISCCDTIFGDAYQGMDGLPIANKFEATANLNGSLPAVSLCTNFGFHFANNDFNFTGTLHKGAIFGLGDVNIWYRGFEPYAAGGNGPIDTAAVNYFFPKANATCYLFQSGCHATYTSGTSSVNCTEGINELSNNYSVSIYPNPFTSQTTITFSEEQKNTTIYIRDVLGELINIQQVSGNKSIIDVSNYAKGVYFVQITDEKKNIVNRKVVLQ